MKERETVRPSEVKKEREMMMMVAVNPSGGTEDRTGEYFGEHVPHVFIFPLDFFAKQNRVLSLLEFRYSQESAHSNLERPFERSGRINDNDLHAHGLLSFLIPIRMTPFSRVHVSHNLMNIFCIILPSGFRLSTQGLDGSTS